MSEYIKNLYRENEANHPRLATDTFFADYANRYAYTGLVDRMIRFIEDFQLLDKLQWRRFVDQFRMPDADFDDGWRGEYWGKMMRGAAFTYSYTRSPRLYETLKATVLDMLSVQEPNGRISSYGANHQWNGWDLWERKYVLLGMQYFLEICPEEDLCCRILQSLCAQADYIMAHIGPADQGKKEINTATHNWRGLNSSSILEPFVRLYQLTGEKRYLDFAGYIVERGFTDGVDIIQLAFADEKAPYQYPVTKAYEMTSCFEGLLEYYRITGIEKYKQAVLRFADRVLETDFTVIGCSGCTHELFDHSSVRQACTDNGAVLQETCVTVTLMKFMYQVHLLTGDARYADAFETSLYNAYFGSVNTEKAIQKSFPPTVADCIKEPLPFDSYSPLVAGIRGSSVGGAMKLADNHCYGCCACIGSAGNGLVPKLQLLTTRQGFAVNLFIPGWVDSHTPTGGAIRFITETAYPVAGSVKITLLPEKPEQFELRVRIPAWCENTVLTVNGEPVAPLPPSGTAGYASVNRCWQNGDTVQLQLDLTTRVLHPLPCADEVLMNDVDWKTGLCNPNPKTADPLAPSHVALVRGPLVLAQDIRLGYSVDEPVARPVERDGKATVTLTDTGESGYPCILAAMVQLTDGTQLLLTDYASCGKTLDDQSKMAAWIWVK